MRVLVADHKPLFRDALEHYIEQSRLADHVVKCADLVEVVAGLARGAAIDIVLIDQNLEGIHHVEDICDLMRRSPAIKFGVLANTIDPEEANDLVKCGLWGYFPRVMSGRAIIDGLQDIVAHKKFLNHVPRSSSQMGAHFLPTLFYPHTPVEGGPHSMFGLTTREQQVLAGLMHGLGNAEIGAQLGIQLVTVKLHMRNLTRKLGARNRTEAALIAKEHGLISTPTPYRAPIHHPYTDKTGQ